MLAGPNISKLVAIKPAAVMPMDWVMVEGDLIKLITKAATDTVAIIWLCCAPNSALLVSSNSANSASSHLPHAGLDQSCFQAISTNALAKRGMAA